MARRRSLLPSGRAGRALVVAAAMLVIVGIGAVGWWVATHPPAPPCSLAPPPAALPSARSYVLFACGAELVVAPHRAMGYPVPRLSDSEVLLGALEANVSVGAYLLNSSAYGAIPAQPTMPPSTYTWTCGIAPACNATVFVPGSPAQYFVVLENLGPTSADLRWTTGLVLYYP